MTPRIFDMDPSRLTRLIQETLHPELPENSNYRQACVFLLVFERLGRLFFLAIQKTDTEGYPWRNQVALPGGHVDPDDDTPLDACFRELEEELCITRDQVTLTGSLGHFQTIKNHNIEAFSGFWNDKGRISHKANEISRVLEIPVSDLMKVHIDCGPFSIIVASKRHFIHFLTADVVKMGHKFGGLSHDIGFADKEFGRGLFQIQGSRDIQWHDVGAAVQGMNHGIDKLLILKTASPPGTRNRVGNAGHMLDTTGQDDIGHAGLDHGHSRNHGFHSGNADPVDGGGRHRIRNACQECGNPCRVQGIMMFQAAPVTHIINQGGIDIGPSDGFFHGDTGQGGAVQILQASAERADGGSTGGNNDHVFHSFISLCTKYLCDNSLNLWHFNCLLSPIIKFAL